MTIISIHVVQNALPKKLPVTRRYTFNITRWIAVLLRTSGKTASHISLMCLTGCKYIWSDGFHATVVDCNIIAELRKAKPACTAVACDEVGSLDHQSYHLLGYMSLIAASD